MPSTRSGASYNPSRSSQKGHRYHYERSQSVREEQGTVLPSNRADTTTRTLSGHLQSQPEGMKQCIAAQRVPDPCRSMKKHMNSYLTVRKFLGHPNICNLLNVWHPLMGKKNMMLLTEEWRKTTTTQASVKTAQVASSSNSNVKKQPQAQHKGKFKAPATNP
ncbi:hypothetical protein O181_108478 [Austropuccinia psidii MF-1]|uniref:Uncharacterized protein n=1 Tax=Austropuccinia psidii MF-1 TaxID=1389203 RepID=A0A9Q3JSW6_9BASI|nr:hypothetical protein [Austropuccinia psidii MF-1]